MVTALSTRLRAAAIAAVLLGVAVLTGWEAADRTRPGLCLAEEAGKCVYELTPHRDGRVTIRMESDEHPHLYETVPGECLRPGRPAECPDWVINYDW